MKNNLKYFVLLISILLLSCNDDEGDNESFQTEILGEEGIMTNLKSTNLDDSGFPWSNISNTYPSITDFIRLKTWNTSQGLIPVKTNGFALANEALDKIEAEVGLNLFDRNSIANIPDNEITKGIIVSQGTALGAFGSTNDPNACGHVSSGVGTTGYPPFQIEINFNEENEFESYELVNTWYDDAGNINTVLYVHIGAPSCENEIGLDLVVHEFGHALGMGGHFEGFGFGPAVDGNFWNVLHTMYNNPTGTLEENIVINPIKF